MSEIIVFVDARVYRLSAVKKAAYRVGDRAHAVIEIQPDGQILVRLTPKHEGIATETLEGEFRGEILDQDLRETIAEETARVRNLLLAQAFSGLSLADHEADVADYREDPLGIAQSQARGH